MKTSVIGFPRVGKLRELKFATEKYFRNEITAQQLEETAEDIRKYQWNLQKESNIDYIPSNDFSFYDLVLDTAVLFNIVPKEYKELNLSDIDTYFAMARGYQGENGDVKALAMKKWFNTNYHYIVPEIEDDTEIKLVGTNPFKYYSEAKKDGIETKPVVVGPFTLLKLARFTGNKSVDDFVDDTIKAYSELLNELSKLGVNWIQFDEPFLVHDITKEDLTLFDKIYNAVLAKKENIKVLLQTYFGDIRDSYENITKLKFDAIGLDFIEGKETLNLIEKYGFPKDKILLAGLVNGKNIWRNNYEKTISTLNLLKNKGIEVVLSTSCSLLHVPFTVENETKLSKDVLKHFAFAVEKLGELADLKVLAEEINFTEDNVFVNNKKLFSEDRNALNSEVAERIKNIKESDFTRLPAFEEREKIQKKEFNLPIFPTTTIGSFPQTADVKANRTAFKKGEITEQEYIEFNKKKIAECVALQEEIGIDVLVHGEYERNDMVEYFGENLDGYIFTEKAWVQSYGTRCVKPPIVWGDISRNKSMTVDWSVYAQSLTNKPMKGMLTGPVTILKNVLTKLHLLFVMKFLI